MEGSDTTAWETRFDWTLTALMVAAYGLAIFFSGLTQASGRSSLWAALISGAYVVVLQVLPRQFRERQIVGEVVAVTGVLAITGSIALTGTENAGYVLLLVVPIFFASAFMGLRIGMETALLATSGLVGVLILNGISPLEQVNMITLYLLVGFTLAQARRLLVLEQSLTDRLRAASRLDALRLSRLEEAHSLLVELADVAGTADLSAVGVGALALKELGDRLPVVAGEVRIQPGGEVVAQTGTPTTGAPLVVDIAGSEGSLGEIRLWAEPGTAIDRNDAQLVSTIAGVSLAFDNIQLLQTVAGRAVHDERTRVARDLHDHIGPELASFGLSLDLLLHRSNDGDVSPQLAALREAVTDLVERVRSTVADLRRADTTTVMDHIQRIALERTPEQAAVYVTVDERHRLAGSLATELGSVVIEAVRNADHHAGATQIHIDGVIDQHGGRLTIGDDGAGFDPDGDYPGHFGLLGMRERAVSVGGDLVISSNAGEGTTIAVVWGDRTGETDTP